MSILKFINFIKTDPYFKEDWNSDKLIKEVCCWFETKDVFPDTFDNSCIKVIAITLSGRDKNVTFSHKKVLDAFHGKQLILSFKHTSFIEIPRTGDNSLLFLEITVEKNKSSSGREYHKRIVVRSADKELIEKIINHKVETPVRIEERLNSNEFI